MPVQVTALVVALQLHRPLVLEKVIDVVMTVIGVTPLEPDRERVDV